MRKSSVRRAGAAMVIGFAGLAVQGSTASAGANWSDVTVDSTWSVVSGSMCFDPGNLQSTPVIGFADTQDYSLDIGGAVLVPGMYSITDDGPATVSPDDPSDGVTTISKSTNIEGIDVTVEYRFDDGRIQTTVTLTNNTGVDIPTFPLGLGHDAGDTAYYDVDADLDADGWVVLGDETTPGGDNYPSVALQPGQSGDQYQFFITGCDGEIPFQSGDSDEYVLAYGFPLPNGATRKVITFVTIGANNALAATAAAAKFPTTVTPGVYPFEDVECDEAPAVNWNMTEGCADASLPSTGTASTTWMAALGLVTLGAMAIVRRRVVRA